MVVLSLRLLGVFSVALEDGLERRSVALSPRSAALLALLALAGGRPVHRHALLAALWPDDARPSTAACLSTALWRLRKALAPWRAVHGEPITGDAQGGLQLGDHTAIHVDVRAFLQLTGTALSKPAARLDAAEAAALADAVALHQGELLVGVSDDWARVERERLRRRFIDTLLWLMRHAIARDDLDEAIRRGRHALEIDPLREDIHRELMACLLRRGQRAHALRQFETCRTSLRDELAIAPMPETMALYRRVAAEALVPRAANDDARTTLEDGVSPR